MSDPNLHQPDPDAAALAETTSLTPPGRAPVVGAASQEPPGAPGPQTATDSVKSALVLQVPGQLGRYWLLRCLGQGAMGSIYLAHDSQLDRDVALKVPRFRDEERVDQVLIERFYREARAAATLRHPNICPVYDVGEIDGVRYISMAYIDGEPLTKFISPGKTLSQQHVALQVHKVAMALQEAHDQGIVHRDLKPGNVMIDRRNEPIVLDFGLARQVKRPPPADELFPTGSDPEVHGPAAEDSRVTQIGTVLGSPAYMSPEQVNGYVEVGPPSDVYSLGVALFELLTGRLPFQGPLRRVLAQILRDPPPNPSDFRSDLDPRLEDITLKMMAKRPHDRFECMRDVALSLVDIARHGPVRRSQVTLNISDEVGFADEDERPASPTRRDAERQEKFEGEKLKVTALCDRLEYAAAKAILERMSASRDRRFPEHSRWAAEQLGRVTAHLEDMRRRCAAVFDSAREAFKQRRYREAIELVDGIPLPYRTPPMEQLLDRAARISDEVEFLTTEIEAELKRHQYDRAMSKVERLLKLQPDNAFARSRHAELLRRSRRPSEP